MSRFAQQSFRSVDNLITSNGYNLILISFQMSEPIIGQLWLAARQEKKIRKCGVLELQKYKYHAFEIGLGRSLAASCLPNNCKIANSGAQRDEAATVGG